MMRFEMTSKERRRLKKIAHRIVIQSKYHADNITEYFEIIIKAARLEFREDNKVTLDDFLMELFQNALKSWVLT